jgi:prepilin-type N-terminal cleavage/methylation domain-containing protein
MYKQRVVSAGREGFTLAEMLVAMALLAVLAAVVVPSILRQVGKGDATRVASDLRSISDAAQTYYADNWAWPDSLNKLAISTASDPYLDLPKFVSGDSLATGGKGRIQNKFVTEGSSLYVKVTGLSKGVALKVDSLVDGPASFNPAAGRVQFDTSADPVTGFKYYIH